MGLFDNKHLLSLATGDISLLSTDAPTLLAKILKPLVVPFYILQVKHWKLLEYLQHISVSQCCWHSISTNTQVKVTAKYYCWCTCRVLGPILVDRDLHTDNLLWDLYYHPQFSIEGAMYHSFSGKKSCGQCSEAYMYVEDRNWLSQIQLE